MVTSDPDSLLKVLKALYGICKALWKLAKDVRRWRRDKIVERPAFEKAYINGVRALNRLPAWDPECLCDEPYLSEHHVRYAVQTRDDPPSGTSSAQQATNIVRQRFSKLASRLYAQWHGLRQPQRNVFLLLGEQGAGKTVLAVQLVIWATNRFEEDAEAPLPVYVNLRYWDRLAPREDWLGALRSLVDNAMGSACPRFTRPVPSKGDAECLEALKKGPLLLILDGMDETPETNYSERCQALADFVLDHSKKGNLCVITCRPIDYVRLRAHAGQVRLQRYDLQPWTPELVERNLKLRGVSVDRIAGLVKATFDRPMSAMEINIGRLDDFIRGRIEEHTGAGQAEPVLASLEKLAWHDLQGPARSSNIPAQHLRVAASAGVLVADNDHYHFASRPLKNYLLARRLAQRVLRRSRLPARTGPKNVNLREAWVYVSDILWERDDDRSRWVRILTAFLDVEGVASLSELGERLDAVSAVIRASQIRQNDTLGCSLLGAFRVLIQRGETKERITCLEVGARLPELFQTPEATRLFQRFLSEGTPELRDWATRVLSSTPRLGWSTWLLWVRLLWSTLGVGLFVDNVRFWLARPAERRPTSWAWLARRAVWPLCLGVALIGLLALSRLAIFLGSQLPHTIALAQLGLKDGGAGVPLTATWRTWLLVSVLYLMCRYLVKQLAAGGVTGFPRFSLLAREAASLALCGYVLLAERTYRFIPPSAAFVLNFLLAGLLLLLVTEPIVRLGPSRWLRAVGDSLMQPKEPEKGVKEPDPWRPWLQPSMNCLEKVMRRILYTRLIWLIPLLAVPVAPLSPLAAACIAVGGLLVCVLVVCAVDLREFFRVQRYGLRDLAPQDVFDVVLDTRRLQCVREVYIDKLRLVSPTPHMLGQGEHCVRILERRGERELVCWLARVLQEFRHEMQKNASPCVGSQDDRQNGRETENGF